MNMNINIQNFRGIASAELDLSHICLLAGENEAGKTSALQAVAAALTGDPVPIVGVKKTQAGLLVRSGTATGSITLTGPDGSTHIQWPSAKVKTEGKAPFASVFAAGLQSIVNLEDKERTKLLSDYLKAAPSRADLDAQLASMNLPANVLEQLWELVVKQGWDNTAAQTKEKGARLKGQWEGITADRYGSKKAENWIPEGYDPELMSQSEEKLSAIITDAADALEAAIAADAVDDSRRSALEEVAVQLPARLLIVKGAEDNKIPTALTKQLAACNEHLDNAVRKRTALESELAALPQATPGTGVRCPDCGAMLRIKGLELELLASVPDEEIARRQAAIELLAGQVKQANVDIATLQTSAREIQRQINEAESVRMEKLIEAKRLVRESEAAVKQLERPAGQAQISVNDCRTTLAMAETRLKAFKSKLEADRLAVAIEKNTELYGKLAPEGIRGEVLARSLKGFNATLEPFTKAAGWRQVALEPDFLPTYGGTPYLLLSESAKFRVRVILQIGLAKLDKSQALIIDAADILDKGGRNGLFKAVKAAGLPAVIAMTMDSKVLVPNLAAAKLGQSYWLDEAVAVAL